MMSDYQRLGRAVALLREAYDAIMEEVTTYDEPLRMHPVVREHHKTAEKIRKFLGIAREGSA